MAMTFHERRAAQRALGLDPEGEDKLFAQALVRAVALANLPSLPESRSQRAPATGGDSAPLAEAEDAGADLEAGGRESSTGATDWDGAADGDAPGTGAAAGRSSTPV